MTKTRRMWTSAALAASWVFLTGALFKGCEDKPPPKKEVACAIAVDTGNIDNHVALNITVTNRTGEDIHFLERHNPLSANDEVFFQVTQDGRTLDYWGPVAKYDEFGLDDIATLKDQASRSISYRLSDYYDFSSGGSYQAEPMISLPVFARGARPATRAEGELEKLALNCNSVTFTLSRNAVKAGAFSSLADQTPRLCNRYGPGYPRPACRPHIEQDCQANYSPAKLDALHRSMWVKIAGMQLAMDERPQQVQEFFGQMNPEQRNSMEAAVSRLRGLYQNSVIRYRCQAPTSALCRDHAGKPTIYAFVIPSWDYPDIFLCPLFYNSPVSSGFDSQEGTLVHEGSHFRPTSTEDHAYGINDARNLARRSPGLAVGNADNYQYFYESTRR